MDCMKLVNGVNIPNIGIGSSAQDMQLCIYSAIKYGFKFFDTAYMYLSEAKLGSAIKQCMNEGIIKRQDLFIQSKAPHTKAGYSATLKGFDESINKIQTDYLDSYLIHYPQRDKSNWQDLLLDTWYAMEKLYEQGKIRAIGVSNFLPHHLDFLLKNATVYPMINQIELHPQHTQSQALEFCKAHNIQIQAWGPLGCGRSYYSPFIKSLANKYNTSIMNLVLNFHKKQGIIPIMGVRDEFELQEIKNYEDIQFDEYDFDKLFMLNENYTKCHNDSMLVDWENAIPTAVKTVNIDDFVPNERVIKLFGFLPLLKIRNESKHKTKYYFLNIPVAKTKYKYISLKQRALKKMPKQKYTIECVFNYNDEFLECPVWDKENELIYCVSSYKNKVYQINPKTKEYLVIPTSNGVVGCIDIDKNGCLIVAEDSGIYKIDIKNNTRTFLIQLKPEMKYNFGQGHFNYNDGKLDAKGRFIVGTAGPYNNNKLYSYDGNSYKVLEHNITISNGIAFSKDNTKMYYTDSSTQKVGLYNYNLETGDAIFERYVIDFDGNTPDGMCIDIDDNLWVAEFDGKKVSKWDTKTFKEIEQIHFPAKCTSVCVGGKDMDYLYVTTFKDEHSAIGGGLYRVKIRSGINK
ncbi:aldo/keto reductase [Helicobacter sp. T3_23-1056]